MSGIEIIPTVVPNSFDDIVVATKRYSSFARTLHVDFADGAFAPNTTWMPDERSLFSDMQWEAHLMVAEPEQLGAACVRAGASRIIGHVEAMQHDTQNIFAAWKEQGASECVLGSLFDTPVETLEPYANVSDALMIMGITAIGVQGLPSDPYTADHIALLKERFPQLLVEVDGAVSEKNISAYASAGARRLCCGSSISKAPDPADAYEKLLSLAKNAIQ